MSAFLESSWLTKLRYTPLRDLFRLRLSGRLDIKHRVSAAEIPLEAKSLILRVVRKTRLWRLEKTDVANELISHFADGLEGGESADDLIKNFGDEKQAAKLIRRAKIRNRSLLWHAYRWSRRAVVAIVALYLFLAARLFLTHPSPSVDYMAEINRPVEIIPEADRAWPLYRKAILASITPTDSPRDDNAREFPDWVNHQDEKVKYGPTAQQWLRSHSADVETIRQGAAKPVYGFVLGPDGSIDDPELWPSMSKHFQERWKNEPSLVTVLLPNLNFARSLANVLNADAKIAMLEHDGDRVWRDITALFGMSTQMRGKNEFLITQLVGLGIDDLAIDTLNDVLKSDPRIFTDAQLTALAHHLAGPKTPSDLLSYHCERYFFLDAIQRMYTDDGHGDGHITADGLKFMSLYGSITGKGQGQTLDQILLFTGPQMLLTSASRKDIADAYNKMMDHYEADLHLPMREVDQSWPEREMKQITETTSGKLRYFLLAVFLPRLHACARSADIELGYRDGAQIGIALELYQRKHGEYPKSLDQLTPHFLPAIPADRITGEPVKYRLIAGKPIVYSVGVDRDDDGGKLPDIPNAESNSQRNAFAARSFDPSKNADGDWILYPQP